MTKAKAEKLLEAIRAAQSIAELKALLEPLDAEERNPLAAAVAQQMDKIIGR